MTSYTDANFHEARLPVINFCGDLRRRILPASVKKYESCRMSNTLGLCIKVRTVTATLFLQTDAYAAISFRELLHWIR
jgi:hypothetical protein